MKNTGIWKQLTAIGAITVLSSGLFAQDVKPLVLEDGTPIRLVLDESVSSESAHTGDLIRFDVVEDVLAAGVIVIPRGAAAWATVTKAEPKKRMGRGGKLDINIDRVTLADGEKVRLSAVQHGKGGGNTAEIATGMAVTSLLIFPPAGALFLLMHGKDVTIPQGRQVTAFTQGDVSLSAAKFAPEAVAANLPKTPATPTKVVERTQIAGAVIIPGSPATSQESLGDYARRMKAEKAAR